MNNEINELKSQIISLKNDFETKFQELKSENEYLRNELNKEKNIIIEKTLSNIRNIEKIVHYLNKYHPFEHIPENVPLKIGQIRHPRNKDEEILQYYGWLMAPFLYNNMGCFPKRFPNTLCSVRDNSLFCFNFYCINVFNDYYINSIFGEVFSIKFVDINLNNIGLIDYKNNLLLKKFFGDSIHYYHNPEKCKLNNNTINYFPKYNRMNIDNFDTLIMSEMNILHYIFNKINIYLEYFTCVIQEKEPTFEIYL